MVKRITGFLVFILNVLYHIFCYYFCIHRESYMSAHVLLNLLNEFGKRDKMRGLHECQILFII